jgi:hypothetical protein
MMRSGSISWAETTCVDHYRNGWTVAICHHCKPINVIASRDRT